MEIRDLHQVKNFIEIHEKDKNNRNIRLYTFKEVILSGISGFYPNVLLKSRSNEYLILPIKEMSMSLNKRSFYEENGMSYDLITNDMTIYNRIDYDVYFFIYNTENYYHFIYDTLPYLYCFLQLRKANKNIKLLMSYNKGKDEILPFVIESLELLGINRQDIIIHESNNSYKKLYLSNSFTHDGLSNIVPRKEIFEIYDKMIRNALSKKEQYDNLNYEKIYISRRTWKNNNITDNIGTNYTTRRKLINEDELVEQLEKYNFIEIFGENYSMVEKILLFNSAKLIVGAIGGTISNCVFSNKSCKIIPLVSPQFLDINYRMKFLFGENVVLFRDTYLDCKEGDIAPNIRIEITDTRIDKYKSIGEIESKVIDKYKIKLGTNYISFSENEKYDTILLDRSQFKLLDKGINSPWLVNLKTINKILHN